MNDKYYTPDQIQELMDAITPAELSYEDWFRAIAGFKSMGADEFQIERWCSSDPRFKSNDIRRSDSGHYHIPCQRTRL